MVGENQLESFCSLEKKKLRSRFEWFILLGKCPISRCVSTFQNENWIRGPPAAAVEKEHDMLIQNNLIKVQSKCNYKMMYFGINANIQIWNLSLYQNHSHRHLYIYAHQHHSATHQTPFTITKHCRWILYRNVIFVARYSGCIDKFLIKIWLNFMHRARHKVVKLTMCE